MRVLPIERLERISKVPKAQVILWEEGISLERDSNLKISDIVRIVASDRWRLASQHNRHADQLMSTQPICYRGAISRYYYAMYHALRACTYISHKGDDFEKHSVLSSHLPGDLTAGTNWQNMLKDARETRNRADYEPYPSHNLAWKKDALIIRDNAELTMEMSKKYLMGKGCSF